MGAALGGLIGIGLEITAAIAATAPFAEAFISAGAVIWDGVFADTFATVSTYADNFYTANLYAKFGLQTAQGLLNQTKKGGNA